MTVFVDTSAFYAVLDAADTNHVQARRTWKDLILQKITLLTTNYVLVETTALVQNRLGVAAVKTFQEDMVPMLTVEWINEATHRVGVAALLTANRRHLSLVDCTSFETARRLGVSTVFAFDNHFVEQGFTCLP